MDNREIDKLVAEKVFGRHVHDYTQVSAMKWRCQTCNRLDYTGQTTVPHAYSTDIAAAWQVVAKMRLFVGPTDAWPRHQMEMDKANWVAWATYPNIDEAMFAVFADTAPMAICLAALKAVGVDAKENGDAQ